MNFKNLLNSKILKNKFVQISIPIAAILIIVLISIAFSKKPTDYSANPQLGLFVSYGEGDMNVSTDNKNWEPATDKTILGSGDRLRSGKASKIILLNPRGNSIRMDENTEISVNGITDDSILIGQTSGRTFNRVTSGDNAKYQLRALNHIITATNAEFDVLTNVKAGRVEITVIDGEVTVSVNTGDQTKTETVPSAKKLIIDPSAVNLIELSDLAKEYMNDPWIAWNLKEDQDAQEAEAVNTDTTNNQPSGKTPSKSAGLKKPATCKLAISAKKDEMYKGIIVKWTTCSSPDFQFYKVLRSTLNSTPTYPNDPVVSSSSNKSYANFIDKTVAPNSTYYYRVCTIERIDRVACSNIVAVKY